MPGLARGGGIWLEMYRPGNTGAEVAGLERQAWESGPRDVAQLLVRSGGSLSRVHLVMSNPGLPPALPSGTAARDFCLTMACQWTRANAPGSLNPRLVANGVGAYRLGSAALGREWLALVNAAEASPPTFPADAVLLKRFREPPLVVASGPAPLRRVGPPRRLRGRRLAVKLQASRTLSVTFVAPRYRVVPRVVKGTRRVIVPMPRCRSCAAIRVRLLVAGKDQRAGFRIAALPADRPR